MSFRISEKIGFQLRELYTRAVYTDNLTESSEYKECLKLLGFLSKEELLAKIASVTEILADSANPIVEKIKSNLDTHIGTIREASLAITGPSSEIVSIDEKLSRLQLKEVRVQVSYLVVSQRDVIYVCEIMTVYEKPNTGICKEY